MDEQNLNEQADVIQNAPKHFVLGTFGALIGAFVAAIPWILMYVYGNMILSALAILIAIGALKGYQIFKGSIDKKLPVIISIISLLVVIITTLLIIPMLLIVKDGYEPSIANLKLLYDSTDFTAAIIHDLVISIIFTILGISGVVANVNKQIKNSSVPLNEIKISSTLSNPETNANQKQVIHNVKDVFIKYDALNKENAIDKNTILTELQELENGKQLFNTLKMQQIIRKTKGKYYFSEKAENSVGHRFILLFGKIMLFVLAVAIIFFALLLSDDNSTTNTTKNSSSSGTNTSKTTTYNLSEVDMEIRAPINMAFASKADINSFFGSGSSEFYKFVLYNEDDLISCFMQVDTNKDTVDNYYESLKKSFSNAKYKIISDYKTETISGFEFTTIEAQIESDDGLYNDLCLGYFVDNKFVCFEYTYPSEKSDQARTILGNIIKKVK